MQKEPKKLSRGLIIVLALTYIFLVVFFVSLIVFGAMATKCADPDIKGGLGDVLKYHFSDMGGLFSFNFHEGSNVIYFSLSGLLYFFIFVAILYLFVGIYVIYKKKRYIVVPALIAAMLVVFVFMMMATGLPKYWAIINNRAPFDTKNNLVGATFAILIFGVLFSLFAYIAYFASLVEAYKNPALVGKKNARQSDEENNDEPVEFEEYIPEPEPEPEPARNVQEKPVEDKADLKSLLKEVVRDIVRDEIARNNANQPKSNFDSATGGSVTGATFGGPLVVQYFNGGIQGATPASQPAPEPVKEAPKEEPEPVVEEPQQEPEVAPAEEPIPEPAPVVEEVAPQPEPVVEEPAPEPVPEEPVAPVAEPELAADEKKPIIRIPFTERMLNADKDMQDNYNELKNEILSYGVNSRVSNSGDTFRLHRRTYVKITIAGLSLKLYFALNPDDYKDSTLPIQNAGHKGIYAEIPLVFKVKSGLSMRRCKQLIQDVFDKNGFEQGEIGNTNWVEELKNVQTEDDKDED